MTLRTTQTLRAALLAGSDSVECSLDLDRTVTTVQLEEQHWIWDGQRYPYLEAAKDRTVYYWDGAAFAPMARFDGALIKLVPTEWGAPTFEIDGIKMLPSARVSPYKDAESKVRLIEPRSKAILDTCGGLGYFAAWCLQSGASQVISYEKSAAVMWLRSLNPWSPGDDLRLRLTQGDIVAEIARLPAESVDAALHDPPRFGIAGELYARTFYAELARVLKPKGKLFHYTGTPNKLTSGRNVPVEVAKRLASVGFVTELIGDGVLACKARRAQ